MGTPDSLTTQTHLHRFWKHLFEPGASMKQAESACVEDPRLLLVLLPTFVVLMRPQRPREVLPPHSPRS